MLRTTALVALAATPFIALAQFSTQQSVTFGPSISGPPVTAACDNLFEQEPLLMYDVSGYGLAGLIHQHVVVYSSGLVTYAAAGGGTPWFPFGSEADITFLPVAEVRSFHKELLLAGAMGICDEDAFVADLPLTTVTVFRGSTDARAHTYSYWYPMSKANENVHEIITKFIDNAFQNNQ